MDRKKWIFLLQGWRQVDIFENIGNVNLNQDSKILVLDEILVATLTDSIDDPIQLYDEVKVKGRLIGFDSLLGELRLDQCVIQK